MSAPRLAQSQAGLSRETSAKQWGEKLRDRQGEGQPSLIKEIPAKDRGPAIEAWLSGLGIGGLDGETRGRFNGMLDAWVAIDADGACQWAEGISDPGMRELAMTGIAGSLADSDPQRAFECLVANGEFRHALNDSRIHDLMTKLSKQAAKEGPAAIVDLWARLPVAASSVDSFSGLRLELEPDTDFRTLLDLMRDKLGKSISRPIYPFGAMEDWMRQDPDAASGYLMEQISAKREFVDVWRELRGVISKTDGSAAADEWTIGMLRNLPGDDRVAFFSGAGVLNSPGRFFDLMRAGASETESMQWTGEALQAAANAAGGDWMVRSLLENKPVEERIELLKTLRGAKALESVESAMSGWQLSESQKEEIRSAVGGS